MRLEEEELRKKDKDYTGPKPGNGESKEGGGVIHDVCPRTAVRIPAKRST